MKDIFKKQYSNQSSLLKELGQYILRNKLSSLVIIISGLYIIYGIIFNNWNVFAVMFIFWAENVIIGIFMIIKMIFAKPNEKVKLFLILFMLVHYGGFCYGHYNLLLQVMGNDYIMKYAAKTGSMTIDAFNMDIGFLPFLYHSMPGIGIALLIFIIHETIALIDKYFLNKLYLHADIGALPFEPYRRIVQLHIGLMAAAFLMMISNSHQITVAMLVLAKIIYDLFHALDIDKNGETRLTINEEKEKIKKEKKNKKRYKQSDVPVE